MKNFRFIWTPELFRKSGLAFATVLVTTILLLSIGRDKLGETVIALLFVVPVGWCTAQWGQGPGLIAAVTAALAFDFCFIPPFYTFNVGSVEGWLVLGIFLAVSLVIVGHIQINLVKAQTSEREAIFMYEMSSALANVQTSEAVAYTIARFIQQRFLPELVDVTVYDKRASKEIRVHEPRGGSAKEQSTCVLPVLNNWGLVCEISIWRGKVAIPSSESRLFKNLALQIGQTLERVRVAESNLVGK
jgi:K+-sensing histidine kinase KdpD